MSTETMDDDATLPEGEYAIVELLGHRTLVGRIEEVERWGSKLLRIEPIYRGKLLEPVYHHASALYGLTPCSREVAADRSPKHDYHLPPAIRARLGPELLSSPNSNPEYEDDDEVDF